MQSSGGGGGMSVDQVIGLQQLSNNNNMKYNEAITVNNFSKIMSTNKSVTKSL